MNHLVDGRHSIRFRLTAWYTGILTLSFALAGAYVLFAVQDAAKETVDKDLRARLASVRSYLAKHTGGDAQSELAEDLDEQAGMGPGGAWMQITNAEGRWLYRSPAIADENTLPPSSAALPDHGRVRTEIVHNRPLRVLTASASGGVVQIGVPMEEFDEMFQSLTWGLGLASPLLLALAAAGGYWMSGRALKPVAEIATTVRKIGARNLSERLTLRGAGDELDSLSSLLNQMLDRLESAFQLVSRFTADASHELRTPVGIIRTTAEVIRSRPRTAVEHEAAWDQVILQSERMSGLIDDLLVLARADAGRSDVAVEPMDLAVTLSEVMGEVRILAESSQLRLTASLDPACPMTGNPDGIRRLLLILLDNAIKYTPAGGEVQVRMYTSDSFALAGAIVEIRDTGPGIEPQHLPHIFERFYRISSDRSRNTGGSGLGLSIARWLASLHGGEIVVESVPGTGSVFRVILPVSRISARNSAFLQNQPA